MRFFSASMLFLNSETASGPNIAVVWKLDDRRDGLLLSLASKNKLVLLWGKILGESIGESIFFKM